MALLTQSESVAFNGFLTSVDFSDVLEWTSVATADGNINIPPPPEKGKEAILAKAAKDLMSLEPNLNSPGDSDATGSRPSSEAPTVNSNWPNQPSESSDQQRRHHSYTYGFGPPSRNSHKLHLHNPPGGPTQAIPEKLFSLPRSQSPASSSSSSPFGANPPPSVAESSAGQSSRPPHYSATSAPSVLGNQRPASSKRSLPPDEDAWPSGSTEPAKRRRPSAASQSPKEGKPSITTRSRTARASSSSSSTVAGSSSVKETDGASTPGSSKPALLSPSQKRANHIQSEQKRRANIRRGYEALCEAVPALREAIRLEEEAGMSAFWLKCFASELKLTAAKSCARGGGGSPRQDKEETERQDDRS